MTDGLNILSLVLKHMTTVEQIIKLKGDEKRDLVISILRNELPNYSEYEKIIPVIIELAIVLSKTKIPLNIPKNCIRFLCIPLNNVGFGIPRLSKNTK